MPGRQPLPQVGGWLVARRTGFQLAQKMQGVVPGPGTRKPDADQICRVYLALAATPDVGTRVDQGNGRCQLGHGGLGGQVAFGQKDAVGQGNLVLGLRELGQLRQGIGRVHQRDHAVQTVVRAQHGVAGQGLNDRGRIGQAGGFDDDAVKVRNLTGPPFAEQLSQSFLQVCAHRAAQAAIGQQADILRRHLDQVVVNADLADLVDHHGHPVHVRVTQQTGDQRGLAAAQKTGDEGDRDFPGQGVALHRGGRRIQMFISRMYKPPPKRSTV